MHLDHQPDGPVSCLNGSTTTHFNATTGKNDRKWDINARSIELHRLTPTAAARVLA